MKVECQGSGEAVLPIIHLHVPNLPDIDRGMEEVGGESCEVDADVFEDEYWSRFDAWRDGWKDTYEDSI